MGGKSRYPKGYRKDTQTSLLRNHKSISKGNLHEHGAGIESEERPGTGRGGREEFKDEHM